MPGRSLKEDERDLCQGFPILINRTASGEQKGKSLLDMSVNIPSLASNIANVSRPIKQRTVLLS
jgi:hypothetical protein